MYFQNISEELKLLVESKNNNDAKNKENKIKLRIQWERNGSLILKVIDLTNRLVELGFFYKRDNFKTLFLSL